MRTLDRGRGHEKFAILLYLVNNAQYRDIITPEHYDYLLFD